MMQPSDLFGRSKPWKVGSGDIGMIRYQGLDEVLQCSANRHCSSCIQLLMKCSKAVSNTGRSASPRKGSKARLKVASSPLNLVLVCEGKHKGNLALEARGQRAMQSPASLPLCHRQPANWRKSQAVQSQQNVLLAASRTRAGDLCRNQWLLKDPRTCQAPWLFTLHRCCRLATARFFRPQHGTLLKYPVQKLPPSPTTEASRRAWPNSRLPTGPTCQAPIWAPIS